MCFDHVLAHGGKAASIIEAMSTALERSDTMAYIVMMAARLIEIRKLMKSTASLYLHCDPAASHYLKIVLDAIFGPENFRNEIVWKRTSAANNPRRWGPVHDVILFYSKSDSYAWNKTLMAHDEAYLSSKYKYEDSRGRYRLSDLTASGTRNGESGKPWRGFDPTPIGRHWGIPASILEGIDGKSENIATAEKLDLLDKNDFIYWTPGRAGKPGFPQLKRHLSDGQPIQDVITDIAPVNSMAKERIGFPTQKPVILLRRIIEASSNPGETVLDPFCGCGTTVIAAAELKRNWIGIDVSYYGTRLVQRRIAERFGPDYPVELKGIPADLLSAQALADRDQYGFQQWVVGELGCQLWNDGKKGADGGIDGEMWFYAGPAKPGRLLVQVKGGRKVGVQAVREFKTVLTDQKAQMGIFFSRAETTSDMRQEASGFGQFKIGATSYPRLQLFTLGQWFVGQRPLTPPAIEVAVPQDRSKQKRVRRTDPKQPEFLLPISGTVKMRPGQVFNPAVAALDAALKSG